MSTSRFRYLIKASLLLLGLVLLLFTTPPRPVRAELYPFRKYNTSDGLAQNFVYRIYFDQQGFAWICTNEGFSRYDGYRFVTYDVEHGLPHRHIRDMVETDDHRFWLATNGGLVYFDPQGAPKGRASQRPPMFTYYRLPTGEEHTPVTALVKGLDGVIWCGTASGLFKLTGQNGSFVIEPTNFTTTTLAPGSESPYVRSLMSHSDGSIWLGLSRGFVIYYPDRKGGGRFEKFDKREGLPDMEISRLVEDRTGRVWAGSGRGLLEIVPSPQTGGSIVRQKIGYVDGLPGDWVRDLYHESNDVYWAATDRGLATFRLDANGRATSIRKYLIQNGLSDYYLNCITAGPWGNIWIGTANAGILKWTNNGFTTYGMSDRIASAVSIFATLDGRTTAVGFINVSSPAKPENIDLQLRLGQIENGKFFWVRPNIPAEVSFSSGWNQVSFQDRQGDWWIPTSNGVYRFPGGNSIRHLQSAQPKAVFNTSNGLSLDWVTRLFEDSRGDIWIATSQKNIHHLDRWERATNQIVNISKGENQSIFQNHQVTAIAEDRDGVIWFGLSHDILPGGLARYAGGRLSRISEEVSAPRGNIHSLLFDHEGRLWAGSTIQGLIRIDNPRADKLTFQYYGKEKGLLSNRVTSLVEDRYGRIYAGTARGLDQLDHQTGEVRHFSQFEGLALGSVDDLYHDAAGAIWVATTQGISTFTPSEAITIKPPQIFIDRLRIGGREQVISAVGETHLSLPTISNDNNQIEIEYLGLSFAVGDKLRYQIRLDQVDEDWVDRGELRSVNYVNLGPGKYQLRIRAINSLGIPSERPAELEFSIAPPFWFTWWFIVPLIAVIAGIGYLIYWNRKRQRMRLESLRTQISADLHDEVGSSLTQIAILSEVALGEPEQSSVSEATTREFNLHRIAEISRAAIDSMEEIVWVVNPRRDSLTDLVQRMRRFAGETLAAKGDIELKFSGTEEKVTLDVPKRRHVYLFFKETINNIVRHSGATEVRIEITVGGRELSLWVDDNGQGFAESELDPHASGGNGLTGLRRRAAALGGTMRVDSRPGRGTRITLVVPLN
ncbi:MAG: two-component regulator propeller domain-containing protein [Acidobacteriota bacterium]